MFETLTKWDGKAEVKLSMPQIKQIAGRAGRFGVHTSPTAPDDGEAATTTTAGEVTTLDDADMALLRSAIKAPIVQVTQAVLQPPSEVFRNVQLLLPRTTPVSRVNAVVLSLMRTSEHYAPTPSVAPVAICDALEPVRPLTFSERSTLVSAPVNARDPRAVAALVSFSQSFASGEPISTASWSEEVGLAALLARVEEARSVSVTPSSAPARGVTKTIYSPVVLADLESFHRCLTLYLWLSYRLPVAFGDHEAARSKRKEVEGAIDFVLGGLKFERLDRVKRRAAGREKKALEFGAVGGVGGVEARA